MQLLMELPIYGRISVVELFRPKASLGKGGGGQKQEEGGRNMGRGGRGGEGMICSESLWWSCSKGEARGGKGCRKWGRGGPEWSD